MLQRQYVLDMLKKYGMTAYKLVATPMEQSAKLRANLGEVLENPTMYRKIVGSLISMQYSHGQTCRMMWEC